jgi:VCBS repeat-containing protein
MLDRNVSNENIEVEAEYIGEGSQSPVAGVEVAQAASQDPAFVDPATGGAIGVPSNGQQNTAATRFVADAANTVTLPVGVSLDNIVVEGDDIILVQADGTRVVIEGGALNVPTFLIGSVEVPQQVLVAALQANGINVAAGPDGAVSVVNNSGSAGGNFAEGSGDIGDAGDTISLLSDTDQADAGNGSEDEQLVDENDAPAFLTVSNDGVGSVTEAVDLSEGEISNVDHIAIGTITFTDADLGDVHTVTAAAVGEGYLGTFSAVITDSATFDGQGTVTWTFTVADNAIDFLAAGETRTQSYVITIADRNGLPVQQTITVNIIGTNDAPVLDAGNVEGVWADVSENEEGMIIDLPSEAVKIVAMEGEASGDEPASEEMPVTHSVDGVLNFTDVDLIDTHVVTVSDRSEQQERNYIGQLEAVLTQDTTGGAVGEISWSFKADDAELDFLAEGQQISQTYIVTVTDSAGATSQQTITVRIYGSNDAPVIESAVTTGSVIEIADGAKGENVDTLEVTGVIAFSDVDNIDTHEVTIAANDEDYLGNFSVELVEKQDSVNEGEVTWTFKVEDSAVDFLAASETLTQIYNVTVSDGKGGTVTQNVTITITGTNDVPVLGKGTTDATVTEFVDGRGRDETPRGFDKDGDERHGGHWGGPAKAHSATGVINFSDADDTNTHTVAAAPKGEAYLGEFIPSISDAATGDNAGQITWKFTVDDKDIDFLGAGDKLVQTYTVSLVDSSGATVTQDVTITLVGTNDRAEISSAYWGGDTGSVVEDGRWPGDKTASGKLDIKDVDQGEAVFKPASTDDLDGTYGTFVFNAKTGTWSYQIDNNRLATQALSEGKIAYDTLTVWSDDGTDSHTIKVEVYGTNDRAEIAGESSGSITEDEKMITGGTLSVIDVDSGEADFSTRTSGLNGKYGTFTFNAKTGEWTYQASAQKVQFLAEGQTVTETLTVSSSDGTARETIEVKISGTNDAPVLTNVFYTDATGSITEDKSEVTLSDNGYITFKDVDSTDTHEVTTTASADNKLGGSLTFGTVFDHPSAGTDGVKWTYAVANDAVQYLAKGETAKEVFTVTISDGHGGTVTETVEVVVTGTNDRPVITAVDVAGAVAEIAHGAAGENTATLTDTGSITFTDVDLIDDHSVTVALKSTTAQSALGNLTIDTAQFVNTGTTPATVNWTYTVNDSALNYLAAGQVVTQIYTVTINDGKGGIVTQDIKIAITGSSDKPIIVTPNEDTSAGDRYAFSDGSPRPEVIDFNAAALFSGVTKATTYSYTAISSTQPNDGWLSLSSTGMIKGNPDDPSKYDKNGDEGLFVYKVTANTEGTIAGTYVAIAALDEDGIKISIQNNGMSSDEHSLAYANANSEHGDYISIGSALLNGPVLAGNGSDVVVGSSNGDDVLGGNGDDALYGMLGDDYLFGEEGNDFLDGGSGNDRLWGGNGNDVLLGGGGGDYLYGGNGADILVGGSGRDYLEGGNGGDTFVLTHLDAADIITDFKASEDYVDLTALLSGISSSDLETGGYVQAIGDNNGKDTLLQIDVDGSANGQSWTTVAVLQNHNFAASNETIRVLFDDSTHKTTTDTV